MQSERSIKPVSMICDLLIVINFFDIVFLYKQMYLPYVLYFTERRRAEEK